MKMEKWATSDGQMCRLGKHHWSVARLFELSRTLKVMTIPLDHLHIAYTYDKLYLREMVMHMAAVNAADLECPIILDEDGELMDGRHRIMKALLLKNKTIKAVRFEKNPPPCKED